MTAEEAIRVLAGYKVVGMRSGKTQICEALRMAITALRAQQERKGRNIVFTGEEQPRAKLTKKAVKDARWERAYKGASFQTLADRYGVSKRTMQNAIKGVTWKCVPYMPEPPEEGTR